MQTAEPVRRAREIEEFTNLHFIHPIAGRLVVVLARLHIRPNAVSLAGMAFGVLAGVAYANYGNPLCAIAGFVLMIAWHVMDGADGQLARLTQAHSETGKILDGICDYVTFAAVYVGLATALGRQHGGWVWCVVIAAGACHAMQAAAYEAQREEYNFWRWGRKSTTLMELSAPPRPAAAAAPAQGLLDLLHGLYGRLQFLISGGTLVFHQRVAAALHARPELAGAIPQRYREVFAPMIRRWSVLSSNYRTLGIFICALANAPLYYFWFEIIGFSVIMVILISRQHARYALFFKGLDTAELAPATCAPGETGRPPGS